MLKIHYISSKEETKPWRIFCFCEQEPYSNCAMVFFCSRNTQIKVSEIHDWRRLTVGNTSTTAINNIPYNSFVIQHKINIIRCNITYIYSTTIYLTTTYATIYLTVAKYCYLYIKTKCNIIIAQRAKNWLKRIFWKLCNMFFLNIHFIWNSIKMMN